MWRSTRGLSSACFAVSIFLVLTAPDVLSGAPGSSEAAYECEDDLIEVVFAADARVRMRGGVPTDLSSARACAGVDQVLARVRGGRWSRICDTPEERIDELTATGEANVGRRLQSPNNMYRLRIGPGVDVWEISRELEALPGIDLARPVPKPMLSPTPGNYESQQGYLRPASTTPAGIDADWAWSYPGGNGSGITVCDLEYSWNWLHADLFPVSEVHIYLQDPQSDDNHGTSVLGVMGSHDNGWGTKGICYGAAMMTCGTYYKPIGGTTYSWNVPGAIADAASSSGIHAGDVLLIEHQWNLPGYGYVPIEWWTCTTGSQSANATYLNIQWATAIKKLHVIEPAGNGNVNLDALNWCVDSGAIIVGAGGAYAGGTWPDGNLQRLSFSSYGARVDLQGWGENVVTTGKGDLYSADGKDYWYTATFDGTSSASPVVAGAVACCAGCWKTNITSRFPLDYYHARNILKSTGTPQITPPVGNIGPRPDLRAAFARLYEWRDATTTPLESGDYPPAWGDYDGDGDEDLYVPMRYPYANRLLRNNGIGVFTDVTPDLLKLSSYDSYSGAWGDYDNDGDLDLYVQNYGTGQCKLFRNDAGAWSDATSGPLSGWSAGTSPAPSWVDYDNDGDIDLYLANYNGTNRLLRNDGGGVFTDATTGPEGDSGATTHAAWADYDNDGDQDLYVVNASSSNHLLRNDGGVFVDVTVWPLDAYEGGNAWWGDYDNDGDQDMYLVLANYATANKLLRNDGGTFADVTANPIRGLEHDGKAGWLDANNDGNLDLYLVNNNERNHLYLGNGSGSFTDDTNTLLIWENYMTCFTWGDCDNDGDIDPYITVYVSTNSNTLVRNESTGSNHWLQVRLVGNTSNRFGVGAKIRLVTSGGEQTREVRADLHEHTLIASFGLGAETSVDSLQVFWPSGTFQDSLNVAADQRVVIYEGVEASSAPDASSPQLTTGLHNCAPNPRIGGGSVAIRYDIAKSSSVRLRIYDPAGRLVRTLRDETGSPPGRYTAVWNGLDGRGRPAPSGAYFYRLDAGEYSKCRRLTLLR